MTPSPVNRRIFLGGTALAALTAAQARTASATAPSANPASEEMVYEVTRTDDEWRARLTDEEFRILREGGTEEKHSSPHVTETRDGVYCCKGCDLTLYDWHWKVPLDIGWVFFRHSRPNAVLTDIDGDAFLDGMDLRNIVQIEAHCRRCGSHLGHIVHTGSDLVHCINGASLNFRTVTA